MKEIKPLIEYLIENLESTKAFVLTQTPEFIQQLIMSKRVLITMGLIFLCVVYGGILYAITRMFKSDLGDDIAPYYIMAVFATLLFIGPFLFLTYEIVNVWFFPKVYLFDYLKGLIR